MSSDSARGLSEQSALSGNLRFDRSHGTPIEFVFEGRAVRAYAGESVASALFAAGVRTLRHSPRTGSARGMFCLMGSCQECVVWADGRRVPACQAPVRAGMIVKRGETSVAS